jgi:hypothetical protein
MRIGGSRTTHDIGAVAIVGITRQSPFLHGFRFDSSKTGPAEQPWTAYSAPSTVPQLSNQFNDMGDIAVSPENNKIVIGGYGNDATPSPREDLQIYDFSLYSGFGSRALYEAPAPVNTGFGFDESDFDWITGLAFSQDGSYLAVSTDRNGYVFNWSNGAISGERFRVYGGGGDGTSSVMFSGVNFWPYDSDPRNGDDELVCFSRRQISHGQSFVIFTYRLSDGQQIYAHSIPSGGAGWGHLNFPVNLSPLLIGGTRTAYFQTYNSSINRYVNGQYQVSDGAPVSYPAGYDGSTDRLENYYSTYGLFDPYGRAIVAKEQPNDIKLFKQRVSDGGFDVVSTYSSDIGSWNGGVINSMFYDKDRDILFVCHRSSPYLTAIQMCKSGFAFKYADMASPASSAFVRASLVYDEKWKSHNS